MHKPIRKAVFPVAGMGTRFLPATKASPKEMLPIVDKPLIQFAAEEAVAAGITQLIFITGRNKRSIPDHFDKAYELEAELAARNKQDMLDLVQNILPPHVSCVYIRQNETLGLGHAVHCAQPAVGDEPFAVLLADDLIEGDGNGCIAQMVEQYNQHGCSILGVENVPASDVDRYGIVALNAGQGRGEDRHADVHHIVEKPAVGEAPSTLAVVGRYILTPAIFDKLGQTSKGAGGEIQLTDGISALLKDERVLAWKYLGRRFDCGSKLGFLQATVQHALTHPELADDFRAYLNTLKSE
jgi:UTP--glucose-1-phosphate uridylyltransferase